MDTPAWAATELAVWPMKKVSTSSLKAFIKLAPNTGRARVRKAL